MAIGVFFNYKNEVVQLPVNPDKLTVSKSSNNETTEVVKLGEVNQIGLTKLAEMTFSSFLPFHKDYGFVNTKAKFWKPEKYIAFFEKVRKNRDYVRFIVTDTTVNYLATIEDFEWYHQAGDSEDIYFSLTLKEYREFSAKFVKVVPKVSQPNKTAVAKTPAKRPANTAALSIGAKVRVNGRLHRDSYGSAPGQTEVNATRLISHMVTKPKSGQNYPIHVTTLDGGWRGWVTKGSVVRI